MQSEKLNDWLRILGMAGIIASLVFVGLQLKQSQDIAIANQYQARLDSGIAAKGNLLQSAALMEVAKKIRSGEQLDQFDITVLDLSVSQLYGIWESNHFQYVSGFISEEHWQGVLREMNKSLGDFHMAEYWERNRHSYRMSFAEIIDTMIESKRNSIERK